MKPGSCDRVERYRTRLVAGVIVAITIALLTPGDPPWINTVRWRDPGPGLQFPGIGQLSSDSPIVTQTGELTIEVWLVPDLAPSVGNQEIISFYEPEESARPLLLGQFPRGFLLHGHADNPGRDPRDDAYIGVEEVGLEDTDSVRHLALTVDGDGAVLHVNGRPTSLRLTKTVARPGEPFGGHLLIGSSNTGWRVWLGEMLGVAVYERVLGERELRAHALDPPPARNVALATDPSLLALYRLEEGGGRRVHSAVARGPDLVIPERLERPTRQRVLSTHAAEPGNFQLARFDIVSNVLGFVPLGFLIAWRRGVRGVALAAAIGIGLSLAAELAQTQIPGRASSLVDLASNGVGTLFGACLGWAVSVLTRDVET